MSHDRMKWWRDAKFGMFIHWGIYAVEGRGEWLMNVECVPPADYEKLAWAFNPQYFDPRSWARLARDAGIKYAVMTTKHHDGFCLFDSSLTEFTAPRTAAGRDLIAEYVQAFRQEGLRVGFYFSLIDWHHPDGDIRGLASDSARRRFVEYVHGQVKELCTRYGTIDILWYDVPYPYRADGWESERLNAMVRSLQPGIIINNRSKLPEDFQVCEKQFKPQPEGRDWELCITLNDNWGFHAADTHWKSAREVLITLADCARRGGNLLLNVGPDADGLIPASSVRILREIGDWMRRNGEAIYGTERTDAGTFNGGLLTVKGNTLYVLIDQWPGREFVLGGLRCQALSARLLATGTQLPIEQVGRRLFVKGLPANPPDTPLSVIAVECDGPPRRVIAKSYLETAAEPV